MVSNILDKDRRNFEVEEDKNNNNKYNNSSN